MTKPLIKEKGTLFNAEMVRATIEGRKTQTRRLDGLKEVNQRPNDWLAPSYCEKTHEWVFTAEHGDPAQIRVKEPYFVDQRVWVRESFKVLSAYAGFEKSTEAGLDAEEGSAKVEYLADEAVKLIDCLGINENGIDEGEQAIRASKKKSVPSIHMPRWASRIDLLVKDVRVERLQEITEDDAIAEGCRPIFDKDSPEMHGNLEMHPFKTPQQQFKKLWQSINGADSWANNPWVWVIEFKKK